MTTLVPQKTSLHEISNRYVVNFDKENGLIMETGVLDCILPTQSLTLTKSGKIKELESLLEVKDGHLKHINKVLENERTNNRRTVEKVAKLEKRLENSGKVFESQYNQIETLKHQLSDTQKKLEDTQRELSVWLHLCLLKCSFRP